VEIAESANGDRAQVSFHLPAELWEQVKQMAALEERSAAFVVRRCLRRYVEGK
jgi:hypothetical protein